MFYLLQPPKIKAANIWGILFLLFTADLLLRFNHEIMLHLYSFNGDVKVAYYFVDHLK